MDYAQLLSILYKGSLSEIIGALNKSVYVTDYSKPNDDSLVLHTGFSFSTHTGKELHVLFDLKNNIIIRQPKSLTVPKLNGIIIMRQNSSFFNRISDLFIFSEPNSSFKNPTLLPVNDPINSISLFIGVDKAEKTITELSFDYEGKAYSFPLQKHLKSEIFMKGNHFSKYEPEIYYQTDEMDDYDPYSDYSIEDALNDATDGQLGEIELR